MEELDISDIPGIPGNSDVSESLPYMTWLSSKFPNGIPSFESTALAHKVLEALAVRNHQANEDMERQIKEFESERARLQHLQSKRTFERAKHPLADGLARLAVSTGMSPLAIQRGVHLNASVFMIAFDRYTRHMEALKDEIQACESDSRSLKQALVRVLAIHNDVKRMKTDYLRSLNLKLNLSGNQEFQEFEFQGLDEEDVDLSSSRGQNLNDLLNNEANKEKGKETLYYKAKSKEYKAADRAQRERLFQSGDKPHLRHDVLVEMGRDCESLAKELETVQKSLSVYHSVPCDYKSLQVFIANLECKLESLETTLEAKIQALMI